MAIRVRMVHGLRLAGAWLVKPGVVKSGLVKTGSRQWMLGEKRSGHGKFLIIVIIFFIIYDMDQIIRRISIRISLFKCTVMVAGNGLMQSGQRALFVVNKFD